MEQLRRAEAPPGGDHGPPCPTDGKGAAAPDPALDADGAAVLDDDAARLDPGADPRSGGDGAGQVADVHAALGVDLAAEGAGAALHAAAGVAVDRGAAGADRGGALHRQLAVAAHPLGVELGDAEEVLGLGVVGVEIAGPADAEALAPVLEDRVGARKQVPELITVVPPTTFATGTGIGGLPSAIVRPESR